MLALDTEAVCKFLHISMCLQKLQRAGLLFGGGVIKGFCIRKCTQKAYSDDEVQDIRGVG